MTDLSDRLWRKSGYSASVAEAIASWLEQAEKELYQFSEARPPQDALKIFNISIRFSKNISSQYLATIKSIVQEINAEQLQQFNAIQLEQPESADPIFSVEQLESKTCIQNTQIDAGQMAVEPTDQNGEIPNKIKDNAEGQNQKPKQQTHRSPSKREQKIIKQNDKIQYRQVNISPLLLKKHDAYLNNYIKTDEAGENNVALVYQIQQCRKSQIISKIIELQKMIRQKREKLFKSDIKYLWFCDMNQKQIEKQVDQLLQQQHKAFNMKEVLLEKFKQKWFENIDNESFKTKFYNQQSKSILTIEQLIQRWEKEIAKILFDNEVNCKQHGGKVYYVCNNDYLPEHIYLCNQCILQIRTNNQHQNHQIVCKNHRQPINWQVGEKKSGNNLKSVKDQDQLFACASCREGDNTKQYLLISKCHFSPIQRICAQSNCIHSDKYLICPSCDKKQKHEQSHLKIKFNFQSLIGKFCIRRAVSVDIYGQVLEDIKQRLKLRPVGKMVGAMTDKMWQVVRQLESYNIDSYDRIKMWVNEVLRQGRKEDMSVLWGVGNSRNRSEEQRRCFLEVFKDKLEQEQEKTFSKICQIMQEMGSNAKDLMNISEAKVNQHLNGKYRRVVNLDKQEKPMRLQCIDHHYGRIQEIVIDKEIGIYQQDNKLNNRQQHLNTIRKEKRKLFYTATAQAILRQKINNKQKEKKIMHYILNNTFVNGQKLNMAKLGDCKQIIEQFLGQLSKIEKQFLRKVPEMHSFIMGY